jgi:hypothetical protein
VKVVALLANSSRKLAVAKNPFLFPTTIYKIFNFFIKLRKKVGFWPNCIFFTYLRQKLWPFLQKFLATKWVFGHKIAIFSRIDNS